MGLAAYGQPDAALSAKVAEVRHMVAGATIVNRAVAPSTSPGF
jgi:hypothetical protein